jgi:hypothetical protein
VREMQRARPARLGVRPEVGDDHRAPPGSGTRRREAVRAATVDAGPTWAARRAAKLKRRAGPRGKKNWAARRAWARSVK